jgi:hypothetical protein
MELVALLAAVPGVQKIIDLIRFLVDGEQVQWRSALITVGSWVLGTGIVALVANSSFAPEGLAAANLADLLLYGVALGSTAGVIHDFIPPANNLIQ